ncbi:MAG: PilZ domain-containing protein [Magnetococcales bacterium]|nr:PilZ domain-containing protein [Magnetococcales bacterium]
MAKKPRKSTPKGPAKQQREFVRVDDQLPLAWRVVNAGEIADVMSHFQKHGTFPTEANDVDALLSSLDIGTNLKQLERSDPNMATILGRLDVKLNMIIKLFHPSDKDQPMVPTPVNLSGNGLAFWEENPDVKNGEVLSVRIALSPDGLAAIDCYARVVHVAPNNREGLTKVACQFEPILGPDRERLISHIFQRQAEQLRSRRTTT